MHSGKDSNLTNTISPFFLEKLKMPSKCPMTFNYYFELAKGIMYRKEKQGQVSNMIEDLELYMNLPIGKAYNN